MSQLITWVANIYVIVLIVRFVVEVFFKEAINSVWFLRIKDITEPVLAFIRKLVPPFQGIDFTYLIAIAGVKVSVWIFKQILFL